MNGLGYSVAVVSTVVWWFPLRVRSVRISKVCLLLHFRVSEGGKPLVMSFILFRVLTCHRQVVVRKDYPPSSWLLGYRVSCCRESEVERGSRV